MLSQTETIHEDPSIGNDDQTIDSVAATTLRLRLTRKLSNTSNRDLASTTTSTTGTTSTGGLTRRRVSWTTETVDNEFLNKKKSKCCCIYQKPRNWNESSSEDENEDHDCQNCRGHRKKDFNKNKLNKDKHQELEEQEQEATEENNATATVCSDLKKINISNSDSPCSSHSNINHDQNNSQMNH